MTAPPDLSLAGVAQLMDEAVVGAVVIVGDEKPVGIVTNRDLAVRALARRLPADSRVDAVMSTRVVTLEATADLREAVRIFAEYAFRRLPLVEEGRMIGMLTVDDLLMDVVSDLTNLVRPITGQVISVTPSRPCRRRRPNAQRGQLSRRMKSLPGTPQGRTGSLRAGLIRMGWLPEAPSAYLTRPTPIRQ